MRIVVVGAGGVGGLVAGLLARAGHEVAVVARGAALEAIRDRGLRVESPLGAFTVRVEAASPPELAPAEAVLLGVKAWQVPQVAATLAPLLTREGFVVPLQNGVEAPEQCGAVLGADRVVGGLCHVLSRLAAPATVVHVGAPPSFTFAASTQHAAGVERLRAALESAGARVAVVDDFPAALWEKFLFIASFGGVAAVARSTAGVVRTIPETRRLLADACEEVRALAMAKGIACAPDVVAKTMAFIDSLPEAATPSLQRDVVAGRPSEIDSLSGAVARIGASLGVPVPIHATIHAALLPLEQAARQPALTGPAAGPRSP
ncbi:MAG TPA: 2-dehydropantoate 2-reductase [Polyangiaceae bacterium]